MDLSSAIEAAKQAVFRVVAPVLAAVLFGAASLPLHAGPSRADYLAPAQSKGGFIKPSPSQAQSGSSSPSSAKKSSTVAYQAFDGQTHQLNEHRGRYVNVLLPLAVDAGPFFSAEHIEELVDRLDLLYVLYAELVQSEPGGSGLANIAFVPQTCGMGCGLIGARGFELLSDESNYAAIISELDGGRLETVLLHEMAHNFDAFSTHLHYLPDHAHAWTDMFEYFAPFRYSRVNSHGEAPDDLYDSPVSLVWKNYLTDESATWERCVHFGGCDDLGLPANYLWAMVYYRIEAMFGIEALLDSFAFLGDYTRSQPPPKTDLDREGLRILSLAIGAGANISCYMDSLKWSIPAATRAEMQRRFGSGLELCADQDADGFSVINGDCADTDAARNMSQPEISGNGQDDDCDELVDEASMAESAAGSAVDNFTQPVQVKLPFEVSGSTANLDDTDRFSFAPPPSGRTRVTLCSSSGFNGWVVALQPDGSFLQSADWYSYRQEPGCASNTFDFVEFDLGGLAVLAHESAGAYTLTVTEAASLVSDHSPLLRVSARPSGGMNLVVTDAAGELAALGTDELEIWISGAGVQLFRPFAGHLELELNLQTVPALQNGEYYQARIRPRANGLPLAAFSAGHLFRYDEIPAQLPAVDHHYSGAWFDPSHEGEGFIVQILEEQRALVYWFTYGDGGAQRWMLGVGEVEGNQVIVPELVDARGGRFGTAFDPDEVELKRAGTLMLSFLDCSTALANFNVDGLGGHQSTNRLSHVYGHGCGQENPQLSLDISGSWYDPGHDGEGFVVEQINATDALVFWFTYDAYGNQSWMFNTGSIEDGAIHISTLLQPQGGQFGRSFNPASVETRSWGELNLQLDCSRGDANYTAYLEGYSSGAQSLVPLARLAESACSD